MQLLNWIRWHFPIGREMAQDVLKEEVPEEHPAYWEAVSFVSVGGGDGNDRLGGCFFLFFFSFFPFPSYISGIHHFWMRFLRM